MAPLICSEYKRAVFLHVGLHGCYPKAVKYCRSALAVL
uniref:Uncharacterized protein n=1 Tax=Anguilla anguilla TaxID=7936 RepID=A0A0E9VNS1_ANGAN